MRTQILNMFKTIDVQITENTCSNTNTPVNIFDETDYHFGIININMSEHIPSLLNDKHIHLYFTIDSSASMHDLCPNGKTKMQHIHHTMENILKLLYDSKRHISVHIQTFSENVQNVIEDIDNILNYDIHLLIDAVKSIQPDNSTNIEKALIKASTDIQNYKCNNPDHDVIHVFLTDGVISDGSTNYRELRILVPIGCTNIFVGYGLDHDVDLLTHLSQGINNEYRFIDALENAGLIYGEILHGIMYKLVLNATLEIENGEIYDYKTNYWSKSLHIGHLLSEQSKTFHIRTKNKENISVTLKGENMSPYKVDNISAIENSELDVYIFRQKTQQILFNAKKVAEKYKEKYMNNKQIDTDKLNMFKKKLNEFHEVMCEYKKTHDLENDGIMNMLCDDIYIAYKTFGTIHGKMFIGARQTSNGSQHTYMCSPMNIKTFNIYPDKLLLKRQTNSPLTPILNNYMNIMTQDVDIDIDELFEQPLSPYRNRLDSFDHMNEYVPSQQFLSPFLNNGVLTMMQEISGKAVDSTECCTQDY